jgi:hypothetical protein
LLASGCVGERSQPAAPRVADREKPAPAPPTAATRTEPRWVLEPSPVRIRLVDAGVQLRLSARGEHGGHLDRTSQADYRVEPGDLARVVSGGYLQPLRGGKGRVLARTPEGEAAAELVVDSDPSDAPWDFDSRIVPLFTRLGCNAGGCHGKADGQNGFHLSLFGYDPSGDHAAIVRAGGGRRISTADPELSLLLLKATGTVPHGGGRRIVPGSSEENLLLGWIEAGSPRFAGAEPDPVAAVEVQPRSVQLDEPGDVQLRVLARHASGRIEDVTRLAQFKSHDDMAAVVDAETGRVRLVRRAETDIVVRFQSHVQAVRVATLINPGLEFDWKSLPRSNVIDRELFARLEALRVPPSPRATDAAFLRRLTLDLTGQLPETTEIREFLASTDPDKRSKKVDELLNRREFVWFWLLKLGDLFQVTQARFQAGAGHYQGWLDACLRENKPWDQVVRELLTSLGDPTIKGEGGPVNYALDGETPLVQAELAAQRFMGQRIRCAQCHDHPFDLWTQDDYYGFAAIFAKLERPGMGPGGMPGRREVRINPAGRVEHLRTKQTADPKILGGPKIDVPADADPRVKLAEWLTQPENPYFARATVNWIWAQFFGKGIADPPDDLSASNPPVHPELLDGLAREFAAMQFDLRKLIRLVATSEAYGLSAVAVPGNEQDTRLFSHHLPRPLSAHQMADALAQATDVPNIFPNRSLKARTKAVQIFDPGTASPILDTFGRCARTAGCASTGAPSLSLKQLLLVIGGDVVDGKVSHVNGYLANLMKLGVEPGEIVENLYLRTLCRLPTAEEQAYWAKELSAAPNTTEAAEDLFWSLLNSREFAFNH